MFEKATREKVRFNYKGQCSVEDLWDLHVEALDTIYKELNASLKATQEESLLETKTTADVTLELQISIVKHIVEVKIAEKKASADKVKNAAKRQRLLALIAKKQDGILEATDIADLQKMADELAE